MKKILKKTAIVFLTFALLVFSATLFACKEKDGHYGATLFDANLSVVTFEKEITAEVKAELDSVVGNLSREFSLNGSGFLARFNAAEIGEEVSVPSICRDLLLKIADAVEISPAFNPTVLPLLSLWHFTEDTTVSNADFIPPTDEEISAVLEDYSFNPSAIVLSEDETTVKKTENVKLEVGGIVKGYATDLLYAVLSSHGYKKGYISFGGSSIAILSANSLLVTHPERVSDNIVRIDKPENAFVSTSGTYRTFYSKGGVIYSHIIDANTGRPADSGATSAVVISKSGTISDATSTAFMVLSFEDAKTLIKKMTESGSFGDLSIFITYKIGEEKKILTNKKQGEFTLLDSSYSIVSAD